MIIFVLIFKFLASDYFYNLTGHKLFYIREIDSKEFVDSVRKETGRSYLSLEVMKHTSRRELIDSVALPLSSVYLCLLIIFIAESMDFINESYFVTYLALFACGVIIYFNFLIYLRMKVFYYGGSKAECEKRCPGSYPRVSYIWSFSCYGQTIILTVLYIVTGNMYCMLGIIVSLILAHMFIFPDYMNKILPYDLRSIKGNYREAPLIVAPIMFIIYYLMILSFK